MIRFLWKKWEVIGFFPCSASLMFELLLFPIHSVFRRNLRLISWSFNFLDLNHLLVGILRLILHSIWLSTGGRKIVQVPARIDKKCLELFNVSSFEASRKFSRWVG